MKKAVVLNSTDRSLFGYNVRQSTNGNLNISDLEQIAKERNEIEGYSIKHIPEIMSRKENIDRIFYILKNQSVINVDISTFIEQVENDGIITTLKKLKMWKTTGARHTKTTFANPYLWMLLALELSPEIYGTAITWLTDTLIINRIEAGDYCKSLNKAIDRFNPDGNQYIKLSQSLNFVAFNNHFAGIRNTGTKTQLKELASLEEKMAFAIDMGYIKSFDELIKELRKIYISKYNQLNQ